MSGIVHNGEDGRLRLQVAGHDDLDVLSALLQDAIIPGEDMFHDQDGRRFVMVVNRFKWLRPIRLRPTAISLGSGPIIWVFNQRMSSERTRRFIRRPWDVLKGDRSPLRLISE